MSLKSLTAKFGLGLFITLFIFYTYSAARTSVGYGDSDELITIGYTLGVAHPSGFPLIILLIKAITSIPFPGTVAFKANLLAVMFHTLTLVGLYAIASLLINEIQTSTKVSSLLGKKQQKYQHLLNNLMPTSALAGVLILAFTPLFWLYSGVIEVFSLNNLLAVAATYTGLRWYLETQKQTGISLSEFKWFLVTCMLVGIGLSNVHVYILMLPGLGLMLLVPLWKQPKFRQYIAPKILLAGIAICALSFIIPNSFLLWLNARQTDFTWAFPQSVSGLFHHILRQDYSGYIPEKQLNVAAYAGNISSEQMVRGVAAYIGILFSHFRGIGFLFGLVGIYVLIKYLPKIAIPLLMIVFCSGVFFATRTSYPVADPINLEHRMSQGITQRQFLLGHTMWALLMPLGLWYGGVLILKKKPDLAQVSVALVGIITCSILIASFHQIGIQRNNTLVDRYAHVLLDTVEDDAVILCLSDVSCYAMMYAQLVEHYRPSVTVLVKNNTYRKYFLQRHPEFQGYNYAHNPYFSADLISWNANNRPTYLSEPSGYYIEYLGLEGDSFYLVPKGYLFHVTKQVPEEIPDYDYQITEEILENPPHPADLWQTGFQDYLTSVHMVNGVIYSKVGIQDRAYRHLIYATRLSPFFEKSRVYLTQSPQYKGDENYQLGSVAKTSDQLVSEADALIAENKLDPAYKKYQYAAYADPLAIEPRWQLIQLYKRGGYYQNALDEVKYLLKYHPDHQAAQQELQSLKIYDK